MAAASGIKTSWADDVEDFDTQRIEETVGPDGVRTIVEYSTNEEGKKIKITRKIRRTLTRSTVDPAVAARKTWAKFGADKDKAGGLDRATTTVGENVGLKIVAGGQKAEPEQEPENDLKKQLENKKIMCRTCKGAHFTSKCPYKDTLGALGFDGAEPPGEDGVSTPKGEPLSAAAALAASAGPGASTGGRYIPPSMRPGAAGRGAGESMGRPANREDMPTLRVTNVSMDTDENDLRDLFSRFGRVARVYIGRDKETGVAKGYAFVSFESKADAEKAMQRTDGLGYDNLILSVSWSQPREQRPA